MNWVGGARNRIKQKHERKIQKEFFERKRHAKKVFRVKPTSPESSKGKVGVSQDLVALNALMKAHDKPIRKSGALRQPQRIDMDHTPLKVLGRRPSNIDLPESPGLHTPSSLQLNTAKDDITKSSNDQVNDKTELLYLQEVGTLRSESSTDPQNEPSPEMCVKSYSNDFQQEYIDRSRNTDRVTESISSRSSAGPRPISDYVVQQRLHEEHDTTCRAPIDDPFRVEWDTGDPAIRQCWVNQSKDNTNHSSDKYMLQSLADKHEDAQSHPLTTDWNRRAPASMKSMSNGAEVIPKCMDQSRYDYARVPGLKDFLETYCSPDKDYPVAERCNMSDTVLRRDRAGLFNDEMTSPSFKPYYRNSDFKENFNSCTQKAGKAIDMKEVEVQRMQEGSLLNMTNFPLQKYFETVTSNPPGVTPMKMGISSDGLTGSPDDATSIDIVKSPAGYVPFAAPGPLQAFTCNGRPTQATTKANKQQSTAHELTPRSHKRPLEETGIPDDEESMQRWSARKKLTWGQCSPDELGALEIGNPFFARKRIGAWSEVRGYCTSSETNAYLGKPTSHGDEIVETSHKRIKEREGDKDALGNKERGTDEVLQELMNMDRDEAEVTSEMSSSWSSMSDDDYGNKDSKSPACVSCSQSCELISHPLVNVSSASCLEISKTLSKIDLPQLKKYQIRVENTRRIIEDEDTKLHHASQAISASPNAETTEEKLLLSQPKPPDEKYLESPEKDLMCREKVDWISLIKEPAVPLVKDVKEPAVEPKEERAVMPHCKKEDTEDTTLDGEVKRTPQSGESTCPKNVLKKDDLKEQDTQTETITCIGEGTEDVKEQETQTEAFTDASSKDNKNVKIQGTQTDDYICGNKGIDTQSRVLASIATQTEERLVSQADEASQTTDDPDTHQEDKGSSREGKKKCTVKSYSIATSNIVEELLNEQQNLSWYQSLLVKLFAPEY